MKHVEVEPWLNLPMLHGSIQIMHQRHDVVDITPIVNAAMFDGPTSLVRAADNPGQISMEILPEPLEIGCTEIEIICKIVGIKDAANAGVDTHSGIGHELHNADAAIPGNHMLGPAAFLPGDGQQQSGREMVPRGGSVEQMAYL